MNVIIPHTGPVCLCKEFPVAMCIGMDKTSALFALMSSNGSHSTRTIDNVPRILGEANSTFTQIFLMQQAIRSDERIIH